MSDPAVHASRQFLADLEREYASRFPRSHDLCARRASRLIDQTSHAVRWTEPFMVTVSRAQGPFIEDLDGHRMVDYWQGHFANILGHNPSLVRDALRTVLENGGGLQSGMLHEVEWEVAEILCRATSTETVRFTTSGSLGTFYAVLLARAFTGRDRVVKVAGGWHGSQPFALKGVFPHGASFDHVESEGLPATTPGDIVLTRFNDRQALREVFRREGDRIACFLVEPILGAGGAIPAHPDYLNEARRLTEKHGALLVCDEIITGFRFRAGDVSKLYGVRPDLIILAKIFGGGMPTAAVVGRRDVMKLCTRESGRVKFEGGTYSGHELSLVAARALLRHLIAHEEEVYPRLAELGEKVRSGLVKIFEAAGIPVHITGGPNEAVPGSSLVMVHPTREGEPPPTCPEDLADPARRHPVLDQGLLASALLLEDVSTRHGFGAISTAHGQPELEKSFEGVRAACDRFRRAGLV